MPLPADILWSRAELPELLAALTKRAYLPMPGTCVSTWIATACEHLGTESEECAVRVKNAAEQIESAAPAILQTADGFIGIAGPSRMITRDGSIRRIDIAAELKRPFQASHEIAETPDQAVISALAAEAVADVEIAKLWQLRTRPGAGLWRQLRETRLIGRIAALILAHAVEYALWVGAWWVIGSGVLEGRVDRGWLIAWMLLLATIIPFRILSTWNSGALAIGFGGLLRQRLLAGTLQLDPAEIRSKGAGQLLGQTIESEAVESLAISGGLGSLLAIVEICVVLVVMLQGSGGWISCAAFSGCLAFGTWLFRRSHRRRAEWTEQRLRLTHDLVEKMTGYRTRLAQQNRDEWHSGEDSALESYLATSKKLDDEAARLTSFLPRACLLAGIAAIAPAFLHSTSAEALAISIGAILLGYRAVERLAGGALQLSGAWIAWTQISAMYRAAARREEPASFVEPRRSEKILEAREVSFAHQGRPEILKRANCAIADGDWILVEGPSGGGKSTMASMLAGMRDPSSGLLLADGLDRRTLGSRAWGKIVAAAPQYHENHVFSGTMAFNLLMGRAWPPTYQDLQDATDVCAELGLDSLLRRMPGGMNQMIGETGWQLSQGERSRLFLARALLQNSRLTILDETLAALDPENLRQSLECALRRSNALMVVAHP